MSLEDIISVSITAQTTTVSRLGFGTPLIARFHTAFAAVVREFKTLKEMTDAGFAATDPAVLMATKIFSQNPKPNSLKVGKRVSAFSQIVLFTPINTVEGFVYTFDIIVGTTTTTITFTNGAAETPTSITTALKALVNAVTGVTATGTTAMQIDTDTAGDLVDYVGVSISPDDFQFKDTTVDPGLAADLTAIETADPDGWFALLLDSNSEAEIAVAAAFIEARKKIFLTNTSDTEVVDNVVTTDVMSDLQSFAFARTAIIYSQARLLNWTGAAWAGNRLPSDPGSSTWAFKTLAGVQVDGLTLTGGQVTVIESKGGNVYRTIAGVNVTTFGITASGEFIDVTRFIDFLDARIKERIFGVLINNAKIPFTDTGVDLMRAQVLAQLNQGITAGGLAADPAPIVTAPKVADISDADKANRILPDIFFQATLAGAIHKLVISGVLSV